LNVSGEFEAVLSVSPDDRYILLAADTRSHLTVPIDHNYFLQDSDGKGLRIVVFDRLLGKLVYFTEPLGVYISNQVFWLDHSTLIIASLPTLSYSRADEDGF